MLEQARLTLDIGQALELEIVAARVRGAAEQEHALAGIAQVGLDGI